MARFKVTTKYSEGQSPYVLETDDMAAALSDLIDSLREPGQYGSHVVSVTFKAKPASPPAAG
jgi:hypothetical protein